MKKLMFLLPTLLWFVVLTGAASIKSETFYQWVTEDGVISLTDDARRIPELHRSQALERSFEDIGDKRLTPATTPSAEYQNSLEQRLERLQITLNDTPSVNPNHPQKCKGPVTITKERIDYVERGNHYNSMFFVARNSCGEVTTFTREQPLPVLNPDR